MSCASCANCAGRRSGGGGNPSPLRLFQINPKSMISIFFPDVEKETETRYNSIGLTV